MTIILQQYTCYVTKCYSNKSKKLKKMEINIRKTPTEIAECITHIELKQLKESLGRGWNKKLQDHLFKKTKHTYSLGYIRNALMKEKLNPTILVYALELADSYEAGVEKESIEVAERFLSNNRKNIIE